MMPSPSTGRQITFPEYENFLDALKSHGGSYNFVTQTKNFPIGGKTGSTPTTRSLSEIEKSVLKSSRVKNVIAEEALRRNCSTSEVEKEAKEIVKEMAHRYNLMNVRGFGYFVCKIMEKLFDGIYVNDLKLKEIRERSKKDCVIFMPAHKTYFDFLLISLICFLYDIQLPAIAAGMDFMSMKFMGEVLRRSGAFFMRRSFGDDQLYWAVFSEYVQSHVVNNDRTVEFFVEATRSRVGKSLHPKYGLLQIVLEPYLRGSVFDLVIVPVSMSYDKILEEKLYAYELLGFPKPKETTSGLLKAREMLNRKSGNCFVTFGDPISAREYFGQSLHRSTFVCQPDSQFVLDSQAKTAMKKFAHYIVELHNKNAVITVWNVACMVMLQILDRDDHASFTFRSLFSDVSNLVRTLNRIGTIVNVQKDLDYDLRYYIGLHDDLFEPFDTSENDFELKFVDFPVEQEKSGVPKSVMERSVSRLILTTYSNAMIHSIDSEAIICNIILTGTTNYNKVFEEFSWLHELMKREFVIVPGEMKRLFERTFKNLEFAKIVELEQEEVVIRDVETATYLTKFILPYFRNFEIVFKTFESRENSLIPSLNQFLPTVQKKISESYQSNPKTRLSFLSTETIKNAFAALQESGALQKIDPNTNQINIEKLKSLQLRLSNFTNSLNKSKL